MGKAEPRRAAQAATATAREAAGYRLGPMAAGLFLLGLGVFWLVALASVDVRLDPGAAAEASPAGLAGAWLAFGARMTLGLVASYVLALLTAAWGWRVYRRNGIADSWPQVLGGLCVAAATAFLSAAAADRYDLAQGGLLLEYLGPPALAYFGRMGIFCLAGLALGIGVLVGFGEAACRCGAWLVEALLAGGRWLAATLALAARGVVYLARGLASALAEGARRGWRHPLPVAAAARETRNARTEAETAAAPARRRSRTETRDADEPAAAPAEKPRAAPSRVRGEFEDFVVADDSVRPYAPSSAMARGAANADADTDMDTDMDTDAPGDPDDSGADDPLSAVPRPRREFPAASAARAAGAAIPAGAGRDDADPDGDGEAVSPGDFYAIDEVDPAEAAAAKEAERRQKAAAAKEAARAQAGVARVEVREPAYDPASYKLPSLSLLDPPPPPVTHNKLALEKRSKILEQTLAEFKIDGRVVHIERGPRVTMYEISLAPGIKLSRVTGLADNIAMMLRAQSVRMIAPIPGKDTIGIEIPNLEKDTVSLCEIVETIDRARRGQALPICLGKDVGGEPLIADLAKMPHLLIAGATGSGKSVCINSVIMSILACCRPDEVKLIMIDPKVVELSRFHGIPHLMCPVITDMKRSVAVLDWVCQKMDERYEQMAMVGVNNIAKFNALGAATINQRLSAIYTDDELELFPKTMPYIMVVIDELADLMMVAGKEVEHHIMRLTAKSRAVGIHLLLATQRPSVNVITGLIKANMPSRIAFQVASVVDSRTILDQKGAETLLGQGDMLFLPPGVGRLVRAQGVFVSDEELFRVVDFAKAQARPQYHADLEGPVIGGGGAVDLEDMDELFLPSGEAIIESQRGSVSLLQRKLGIGYGRASRIIDQLAAAGVLGPFRDGKAREIMMTLDEFTAKFASAAGKAAARRLTMDDEGEDNSPAGLRPDERPRAAPWEDD